MVRPNARRARFPKFVALAGAFLLAAAAAAPPLAASPKDPRKVPSHSILLTTTITAGPDLAATLVEYITGDRSEKTAINLLVGLYRVEGEKRTLLSSRDYNADAGGFVSRGSLQVIDLDRDGVNEILLEYHHAEQPGSTRVDLDIMRVVEGRLVLVWSGPVRVDTTSPSLELPPSERERFVRELDLGRTAAMQGQKLCFTRTVSVAAGATLDPPRVMPEEIGFASVPRAPAPSPAAGGGAPPDGR